MKSKTPYGLQPFKSPEGWAQKSKVSNMVVGEGESKRVVGIKVETFNETFTIPVVDARVSDESRQRVDRMINAVNNGSKFYRPSFSLLGYSYNVSAKGNSNF